MPLYVAQRPGVPPSRFSAPNNEKAIQHVDKTYSNGGRLTGTQTAYPCEDITLGEVVAISGMEGLIRDIPLYNQAAPCLHS
jgi:hypothetical protein